VSGQEGGFYSPAKGMTPFQAIGIEENSVLIQDVPGFLYRPIRLKILRR
jgi:hypothetical protein